ALALARCLDCAAALDAAGRCAACGRRYAESGGILDAMGPLAGRDRVAAGLSDGAGGAGVRPWGGVFLRVPGGPARARGQILRHLPRCETARVLEVGIGDGENLPLLPEGWKVYGIDIARTQLRACVERFPLMAGRLAWAEAEAVPFADGAF